MRADADDAIRYERCRYFRIAMLMMLSMLMPLSLLLARDAAEAASDAATPRYCRADYDAADASQDTTLLMRALSRYFRRFRAAAMLLLTMR